MLVNIYRCNEDGRLVRTNFVVTDVVLVDTGR
jgi:hypothetical protein